MACDDSNKTCVREAIRTAETSSADLALIVGGLVGAVGFIP